MKKEKFSLTFFNHFFREYKTHLRIIYRARLLKMRIGPQTPFIGHLLRTSCTIDEICLSDLIPETGEKYPNRKLEIELETTRPPKLIVKKSLCLFL